MEIEMPYFMTNEDWYDIDEDTGRYVLTDKATDKAKESFKKFYEQLKNQD